VKGPLLAGSLVGRILARRVQATERLAVEASRLILACSTEDAEGFRRLYGVPAEKILEVPNGVDCREIRPADPAERARSRHALGLGHRPLIIFVGSNYYPNLEGAAFIIGELAPIFPDVQFGIVGGVGLMFRDQFPAAIIPANVTLYGFVAFEKLLEVYRAAHVALNPMRQGSGTNIKMLDYMAAGLPILTTAKGSRGLGGRAGEHWIEARLEDFATELRALLGGPERCTALGERTRRLARERFDWVAIAARYAGHLRTLVSAARPA
jgi:glycosyltransferase involved in cell wall biosynthesis